MLYVYTGANGSFQLYEDENLNYNYQQGNFSIIPFAYEESTQTLTIGDRKGNFYGMLETRTIQVIWINKDRPVGTNTGKPDAVMKYAGKAISIKVK